MPLTLEQYAVDLDRRGLPWPVPPKPDAPKVRAHLRPIEGVRAVLWTAYGTLLNIVGGELKFEVEQDLMMTVALEKTIHEFKMWASMSRKPGQPSEYMREIYRKVLDEQRLAPFPDKYPELQAEKCWESIIKKLFQKEYKFDAGYYGSLNDYAKKIGYFFHASLQGVACYDGAAEVVGELHQRGVVQGLLADGQCFTPAQVFRCLKSTGLAVEPDLIFPPKLRFLSSDVRARKPSDLLFEAALDGLGKQGIEPSEVLHVGSSLPRDIGPAKKWGMKTALFAGDRASLVATGEQLKDPQYRPDALLTELRQVVELLG